VPGALRPFRDLPPEVPVLAAISFTVALGYGIVAPAIPEFARQFGVSAAAAASVISAFALMRIAGALPAGRLLERFGGHAVMVAGIAIVAASSLVAGFSGSFAQLIILRGVGGLGSAMYTVSARTVLLVSVPEGLRGRASGLFSGAFLLGAISGPAVGGLVTELTGAIRSRAYRAAASATFADGFAAVGVGAAIVPLFVHDVLHRPPFWTGIGFLAFAALNAAGLLPGGRAADIFGRRPVIIAGCAASAGGMVMLAFLPGLAGYLAGIAVSGLGSGLLDVAPAAMLGDLLAGRGGTLVALYEMAGDAGAVSGPVAAGFLVDTVSYPAAFGLAAAVLGLAAAVGLFAPETRSGIQRS
jgi:DHA1 family multidrug resistance protein-like MFS transporter